jgi:hypothetical protein
MVLLLIEYYVCRAKKFHSTIGGQRQVGDGEDFFLAEAANEKFALPQTTRN